MTHYYHYMPTEPLISLSDILTLLALLVAFFGREFWKWLARPKIKIYFNQHQYKFFHRTNLANGSLSIPAYYLQLEIKNEGKDTLKNVEVVLEESDPTPENFRSLNLHWSGYQAKGDFIRRTIRIPRGQSRMIDFIEIWEPEFTYRMRSSIDSSDRMNLYSQGFRICSIKFHTFSDIFKAGKYIFTLGIYADGIAPKFVKLSVEYDGKSWVNENTKEIIKKHFKAKLVG